MVVQTVKNLLAMQETWILSLSWENPLEKGMATHTSILAWRIPWTEEPGGLQSTGLQRVRHSWTTNTFTIPTGPLQGQGTVPRHRGHQDRSLHLLALKPMAHWQAGQALIRHTVKIRQIFSISPTPSWSPKTGLLKLSMHTIHSETLLNADSDSACLGWELRSRISNKHPIDIIAADVQTTLWTARMWEGPSVPSWFLSLPPETQAASKAVALRLRIISTLLSLWKEWDFSKPNLPPTSSSLTSNVIIKHIHTYTPSLSLSASFKFLCFSCMWLLCTFHIGSFQCQMKNSDCY